MQKRFGVDLDPATEIASTVGSKEAIFHFPEAILNPGDVVIVPSPGYPPMKNGTVFSEGVPYFVPIREQNGFLVDFKSIPEDIARRAKILWINYPNSPTGAVATLDWYRELVDWAQAHDIIIAADEGCYIDLYYHEPPHSILEVARDGIITFYSLSKRNNMTGYRVGFVAGDSRLVSLFKKLKTNIDSGTPDFVQAAAMTALADDDHVASLRGGYAKKKEVLLGALRDIGLPPADPKATFYVWQKVPEGMTSLEFATRLLADDIALVVTPGSWISEACPDGTNPGEGYVRFALVPTLEQVEEAAGRLRKGNWRM
jgi:LL-diaminopimelate aminotransferase